MLKEIRRQIARANDIAFVTEECKHKGDCSGTCPKCESEVVYLEEQLARRRRLGLTTKVVGLSLGLAAIAPALVTSCTKGDLVPPDEQLQGDVEPYPDHTPGIIAPDQGGSEGEGDSQGQGGNDGQGEGNGGGQG